MERVVLLRDRVKPYQFPSGDGRIGAYLAWTSVGFHQPGGAGRDRRMVKEIYVKTDGRPVEVVNKGLSDIWTRWAPLEHTGVATTGSGRELIGELIGADTITTRSRPTRRSHLHRPQAHRPRARHHLRDRGRIPSTSACRRGGGGLRLNEACAAGTARS